MIGAESLFAEDELRETAPPLFLPLTTDRRLKLIGWARNWMSYHRLVAKIVGSHMLERKTGCTSMGID
jgi:hypothetical protein